MVLRRIKLSIFWSTLPVTEYVINKTINFARRSRHKNRRTSVPLYLPRETSDWQERAMTLFTKNCREVLLWRQFAAMQFAHINTWRNCVATLINYLSCSKAKSPWTNKSSLIEQNIVNYLNMETQSSSWLLT